MTGLVGRTGAVTGSGQADERRSRLLGVKLRALVAGSLGVGALPEPVAFPDGAALLVDRTAWVLLDQRPDRRLGAALAWALRRHATELRVVVDGAGGGAVARRSASLTFPVSVWRAEERSLAVCDPAPLPTPPPADPAHLALRELIAAGGATPVVEHGVVFGEVRGLEVCRVVDHDGEVRLEVGVGVHDREAFAMIHGDVPPVESLTRVVDAVTMHRTDGEARHPLSRIASERLLRWRLEQAPGFVGATRLQAVEPPLHRGSLRDVEPCVARGIDGDGGEMVVVCSTGVDLDLVPYATDARLAHRPAGVGGEDHPTSGRPVRLVLAVPTRDRIPILVEMAGLVGQASGWSPVEVLGVEVASIA